MDRARSQGLQMLGLSGFKLTFDDEFNTRSISQAAGSSTWGDIRVQGRADANSDVGFGSSSFVDAASGYDPFTVAGGALTITASPDRTAYGAPGSWESGLITTQGSFSQTYGYFEVRADFSKQLGAWDAFWLLPNQQMPDPNNAGNHQELDVVERYGDGPNSVYNTIHTTDAAPNQNWQRDLQVVSQLADPGGYHTYGVNWQADAIGFYVDGQLVGTKATPSDMHGPMYLLANLAVQTNIGGNDANAASGPLSSAIDYIRVYSNAPDAVAVPLATVSAPDGRDPGLYGATATNTPAAPASTPTPATTLASAASLTLGSGSDRLMLHISEDAYQGDAQYTIAVDGQLIGGVQTAHAAHGGLSDFILVQGDWGMGDHKVALTFLNDAWSGTVGADRNLYLDSASYNGADVAGAALTLLSQGGQNFVFHDTAAAQAGPSAATPGSTTSLTLGSGSDKLMLHISEDAYQGDAQYTIAVDGQQIGGVQTAHAAHGGGLSDLILVQGSWGAGDHTVALNFLNDAWSGTVGADRNLYLDSASYNGADVAGAALTLLSQGGQNFVFHDMVAAQAGLSVTIPTIAGSASAPVSAPTSTSTSTPVPVGSTPLTLGSGSDKLMLHISEDAYQGDAQYTIAVDGQQIGGVQTAHAAHGSGLSDLILVQGDWGTGDHTVALNFLNDAWGGTVGTDRNLYLDSASYNGADIADGSLVLMSQGTQDFAFLDAVATQAGSSTATPAATGSASGPLSTPPSTITSTPTPASVTPLTLGSGSDQLMLHISEDAYQGDAQYTIAVDGQQIGGVQTAHAAHGSGTFDQILVQGSWGAGDHKVALTFLNDAWNGATGADRNLYLDSVSSNGAGIANASLAMLSGGTYDIAFHN